MQRDIAAPLSSYRKVVRWAAGAGVVGTLVVWLLAPNAAAEAYLFAFVLSWLAAIGSAGMVSIGCLTGGRWAMATRPFLAAGTQTLPLVALLFVPIALSVRRIYVWAGEGALSGPELAHKAAYLETTAYLWRSAGYIAVWLIVATALHRTARPGLGPGDTPHMRLAGGLSLVALLLSGSFAVFDWIMSLEPHWYSSIYGALQLAGGTLAALALATLLLACLPRRVLRLLLSPSRRGGANAADAQQAQRDLGNLLLAEVMFWTYLAVSQYLLIWSANLPSQVSWYRARTEGGWGYLAVAVVLLLFVAPFLALLPTEVKRSRRGLRWVAAVVLLGILLHALWSISPGLSVGGWPAVAAHTAAVSGVAGVWAWVYLWRVEAELHKASVAAAQRGSEAPP